MAKRQSGILLSITSLPGKNGIGTLGKSSFDFVDFLKKSGQSLWQVLPLGPTGYGDSPYASFSSFAGNPLLIDFDLLVQKGWATADQIHRPEWIKEDGNVEYGSVVYWKSNVLSQAAPYFLDKASVKDIKAFEKFCQKNSSWLNDWALFTSIKKFHDAKAQREKVEGSASMWNAYWPKDLARHDSAALAKWEEEHLEDIEEIKVIQFFFYTQWNELRKYAKKNGVQIIGDIPIFVASDSCDFWANQKYFLMDSKTLAQTCCAGVPPDYFSATGQLWGNPLYDWDALKNAGYDFWVRRVRHMMSIVDIVRIDHFRGFESYWKVPYGAENAIGGEWEKGPGLDLFRTLKKKLGKINIIAEDLGILTPEVEKLRDDCKFPGMKIIQFAFNGNEWNEESAENAYLPSNYTTDNCAVYTGTHDNDTTMGCLANANDTFKKNVCDYFRIEEKSSDTEIAKAMLEGAATSKARICIIPLQDVIFAGNHARMNTPSTASGNWTWRAKKDDFGPDSVALLKYLSSLGKRK